VAKKKAKLEDLLAQAAEGLPEVTELFHRILSAPVDERPELDAEMKKLEEAGDVRYVEVVRKIASSFITPFDREDIYQTVEAIDDIIDQLDHASALLVGFHWNGALPEELVENANKLNQMSQYAPQAVAAIKKPKKFEKLLVEVSLLENEMDTLYRDLLVRMLNDADAIDVMKIKVLADAVESCSTALERFIRSVGVMAIKET